jgi:hypothetical protein
MSAFKDPHQATTFIYSNFYDIYRKSKLESLKQKELATGVVLKSRSLTETPSIAEVRVVSSKQAEELSHWSHAKPETGKKEMALHLRDLRDARKRLVFLMAELEELLKRE